MTVIHTMNAQFIPMPGATKEQIVQALAPLLEYNGWGKEDVLNGKPLAGEDWFNFQGLPGDAFWFTLHSSGESTHDYEDVLAQAAQALEDLVQASRFELVDNSAGRIRDRVTQIWVGKGDELERYKRDVAASQISELMGQYGLSSEVARAATDAIVDFPLEPKQATAPRPAG